MSSTRKTRESVSCECIGISQIVNEIKKKLEACYKIIKEQNTKIDELQNDIKELKEKKDVAPKGLKHTYAEALNKPEHVIVVKPRQEKDVTQVREDLKNTINPTELQVGLNIEKNARSGGVILKCSNEKALNTIKNDINTKMGNDYEIQVPKKLSPRIIIVGIDKEEIKNEENSDEDLINKIIMQNRIPQSESSKLKFVYKTPPRRDRFNLIIETDASTFKYLMNMERQVLHVGWTNCKIYEYFSVKRCFKCGGYNHEAKECTEKVACVICSEEHNSNECRSNGKRCVNCVRANAKLNLKLDIQHTAFDRNCECYVKIVESITKKIAYQE